ncbi:MAG: hypothetical protein O6947_05435, partial [Acidobacteria bacterium]|nr:hypothetical protein [Acidobacteriota bacterium]
MDFAKMMPSLSQITFSPESLALERPERALVLRIDVRFQPMQVERVEREADQHVKRFRRKSLPPRASTQRDADLGAPMRQIDVEEGTCPEHLVGFTPADAPLEQAPRSEELVDLLDEFGRQI